MAKLNEKDVRAIVALCGDCDELDGWGFTRPAHMLKAVADEFGGDLYEAGKRIARLLEAGLVEVDLVDEEVWVSPETYASYFC